MNKEDTRILILRIIKKWHNANPGSHGRPKGYILGFGNLGLAVWPYTRYSGPLPRGYKQGVGMSMSRFLKVMEKEGLVRLGFEYEGNDTRHAAWITEAGIKILEKGKFE